MRNVATVMGRLGLVSGLALACAAPPIVVHNRSADLRTWEVGTGQRALILLHGFGSTPAEWLPFTRTVRPGPGRRFVFPEGPGAGPRGLGRGWWPLDLASHLDSSGLPDLSRTRPAGLAIASAQVRALLADVEARLGSPRGTSILGGFSQGGMVSAEIAFTSATPLKALVLLSPTVVDEASWGRGMPARRGLPVLLAHGRQDDVLPYAASARLAATMRDAGLAVTWLPFDGGHDVPGVVVTALNRFLADVDSVR